MGISIGLSTRFGNLIAPFQACAQHSIHMPRQKLRQQPTFPDAPGQAGKKIFAAIRLKGHLQGYSTLKKDRLQASDDRQTAQPAPDIWSQAQRPMSRPDGIDGAAQGPVFRKFPWQNSGLGGVGVTLFLPGCAAIIS
jgi:hypothetical protein